MVFGAQRFSASFQYVPVVHQMQSGYEQIQILRMECGEAAWLSKNKKIYQALRIVIGKIISGKFMKFFTS